MTVMMKPAPPLPLHAILIATNLLPNVGATILLSPLLDLLRGGTVTQILLLRIAEDLGKSRTAVSTPAPTVIDLVIAPIPLVPRVNDTTPVLALLEIVHPIHEGTTAIVTIDTKEGVRVITAERSSPNDWSTM